MTLDFDEAWRRFGGDLEQRLRDAVMAVDDGPGATLLSEMAAYHLATGGKRLRALLPPWIAENLGGLGRESLDLGVGLELIHNATLVHDDVQDRDVRRRGQPTVWHRWGEAQAINLGDALYFRGMTVIGATRAARDLVEPLGRAMIRLIAGQAMEFQLQDDRAVARAVPPTPEAWEQMARGKTGALFGACFRAGVVGGGGGRDQADAAARRGEALGLLFQAQDDYLDLVGEKGRGRPGSDLAEGKLSFPVVRALAAGGAAAERLRDIVGAPREQTTGAMVDEGLDLLSSTGALEATAAWLRDARDRLESDPLDALTPGLVGRFLAPVVHAL
ncbi:MAG: polyprenyl synthetase family protein [Myxococcota bacterium]